MNIPGLSRLWNKEPRRPLNLLAPDLLCEAHIHVLANGESKMYVSKLSPETPPEDLVQIVRIMMDQVIAFGRQHHVEIQVRQEGRP